MNLLDAYGERDVERVKELIEQGEDPTIMKNFLIKEACRQGYLEIVKALLEDGRADPTVYNNWPLRVAVMYDHRDVVDALLEDGRVDPDPTDDPDFIIRLATEEVKEKLINYKYRVDGKEYCRLKTEIFS